MRASVSGNSLSDELRRYLNTGNSTLSSTSIATPRSVVANDESSVHERALTAILEVVTSNSEVASECVLDPDPPGGVQEWWARMLSGSMINPQSTSARATKGEIQ
jgi:hypothetical protein